MNLTSQQEEEFLKQNDRFLWQVVNNFVNQGPERRNHEQDFHSLCVMELLKHLREAPDWDAAMRFPVKSMLNAMSRLVISSQVLTYPDRTGGFADILRSAPTSTQYEEERSRSSVQYDMDGVLTWMSWNEFVKRQTPINQEILRLKLAGLRNHEVALATKLSDTRVSRRLKQMRDAYLAFVA